MPQGRGRRRGKGWIVALVVVAVVASVATGGYFMLASGGEKLAEELPTAEAVVAPMLVKVVETGEVEAEHRKVIRNETNYQARIKSLVADGTAVEANDVIIEFDCQELLKEIDDQELKLDDATNEYTQAEKDLELKQEEMDSRVRTAENDLIDANAALQRYVESEYDIKLQEYETEIDVAKRNLAVAKDQLELKLKVNEDPELKGLYSEKVIEAARFDVSKFEAALDKARMNLAMFKKFDDPKERRKLKLAVADAQLGLKRAQLEARNELIKARAFLRYRKTALEKQQERLEELREQEESLVIRAPERGLVIYNTSRRRWQDPIEVAVDETISPRQQLMIIPDMTSLQVETRVLESMYKKTHPGLKAYVRLFAHPDKVYEGEVHWVAPQANQQDWFRPEVMVHEVIVKFDQMPADLRPKMTGTVELIVAEKEECLQVPVAAVFTEQEKTFVWLQTSGGPEKREIHVGLTNDTHVEVTEGLQAGDEVFRSATDVMMARKAARDAEEAS